MLTHCLTIDLEEHFQASEFDSPMRRRHWDQFESRVERHTEKLLELLAVHDVRATFFVLGWVAERHPGLVRAIARAGHEVASHGYAHELVTAQTPATFREDVRKAKGLLEDILGLPVLGYRAPSVTITQDTSWAFPILVEEGYVYDSSVSPNVAPLSLVHQRNGKPAIDGFCHCLPTEAGPLWEIPPSIIQIAGVRMSIAGGLYFRLFPKGLRLPLLKRVERSSQRLVMCLRSWELDPDQPRMAGPLLSRFRHYVNLRKTEGRLVDLLREFSFVLIRDSITASSDSPSRKTRLTQGCWIRSSRRRGDVLRRGRRFRP
jgi:polysaccharide deacetylase family protein (PEP-CTERM system associated)